MAGKSRAGQAGYHEGRDSLGRKAWLADEKDPQKVSGKSSAQVLDDLRRDLEGSADIDRRKAQEFVDSFVDFVDSDHADQFLHFERIGKGGGYREFIRFSNFADKYAENKEDLYMAVDFSHHGNNPLADAANNYALETMFEDEEEQLQCRADISGGEMVFPVENLFDDDFSDKVAEIQYYVSYAGTEGGILNEDIYGSYIYDVGESIAPEGSSRLEDIKDDLSDSLVEEYGDVRDGIDTAVNQGSIRKAFEDMMIEGSIDPADVDYDIIKDKFEVSGGVIPEIARRAWEDNR